MLLAALVLVAGASAVSLGSRERPLAPVAWEGARSTPAAAPQGQKADGASPAERGHDGESRPSPRPSACRYGDRPAARPAPSPSPRPARRTLGASVVLVVTGVVSAEGWVPPPGETCPPAP